jgi:FMN phosphatase YigB (HAD superfamily)
MHKQKIVLFDIDYTLFNAQTYRNQFTKILFEQIGYENKEKFFSLADKAYTLSKNKVGYFDPHNFLHMLSENLKKKIDIDTLEKVILNEELLESALYEEVVGVFTYLHKKKDLILGIFSAGRISLQRPKVNAIQKFLQKEYIHIYEFKKGKALPELLKKYNENKIYFIDDIVEILYNAKKIRSDITTIWIQRGIHKDTLVEGFLPDKTIHNLHEIIPILEEN